MSWRPQDQPQKDTTQGCGTDARGKAAWAREKMAIDGEWNKEKYQALSACVHCKSPNSNCPCTTAAEPYFRIKNPK